MLDWDGHAGVRIPKSNSVRMDFISGNYYCNPFYGVPRKRMNLVSYTCLTSIFLKNGVPASIIATLVSLFRPVDVVSDIEVSSEVVATVGFVLMKAIGWVLPSSANQTA